MSHILSIDLKNLQSNSDNFKVISFPKRIKVLQMSFSVNGAAAANPELDRVWQLYAWGGHPTPTTENPWNEWSFPVFNFSEKPVINNETASYYSTIVAPYSELLPVNGPVATGVFKFELHGGVFAPNDYMVLWVENVGGNIEGITWEDTEATINIVYEETSAKTPYELAQKYPWWD